MVLLDNGRSQMLGNEFHEMLRCIRCGACMNHCPVYQAIGGHAYGWVYVGPMGTVLTPLMVPCVANSDWPASFSFADSTPERAPGIYLVDPQGYLMMRYPQDVDRRGLLADLERLLKISQIG